MPFRVEEPVLLDEWPGCPCNVYIGVWLNSMRSSRSTQAAVETEAAVRSYVHRKGKALEDPLTCFWFRFQFLFLVCIGREKAG